MSCLSGFGGGRWRIEVAGELVSFLVHSVMSVDGDFLTGGIVDSGAVRCGTVFREVALLREDGSRGAAEEIELSVVKIVAYQRDIDELPQGMSGGLHLRGRGGHLVKENTTLRGS
jgi:hypothetical protein